MDTYIFTLDVFATDIKNKVSIVFVNFGLGASDNVRQLYIRHYAHLLMGAVWPEKSLWAKGPIN